MLRRGPHREVRLRPSHRKALGLQMHDEAPSLDTYYLFRRRICEYADRTGENLMETCFSSLTGLQVAKFKICGKSVRMDSKLIGSNIAWYPRYELIHKTFLQEIGGYFDRLNPSLRKKVQPWLEENAKQTVYRSDAETIRQRLGALGRIIYAVLVRVKANDGLLKRVFEEQYAVEHGQVTPRDKKQIAADSVQNPNDPDAEYRQKGQQKVKGYSVNITETTDQREDAPTSSPCPGGGCDRRRQRLLRGGHREERGRYRREGGDRLQRRGLPECRQPGDGSERRVHRHPGPPVQIPARRGRRRHRENHRHAYRRGL